MFCLFITDEGGHGLWRLRLVERLCAAHGEPIDDPSGNRTSDGTAANVTPRVWTMADPANATAPIPADAIDRMVRCLGAFQLFLFPYLYGRLVSDVVFCLSPSLLQKSSGRRLLKGRKRTGDGPKRTDPTAPGSYPPRGTSASLVYPPRGRDRGVNWSGTGGSGTSARCVFIFICPLMSSSYDCLPVR